MVDYQSYYRVYAHGLTGSAPRVGVKILRDLYHENGRKVFSKRHDRPVHDCRHEVMKEHTDGREFETWLLSHGLTETYSSVAGLHTKTDKSTSGSKKKDKLLYKLGRSGEAVRDFNYPRGIRIAANGDILVADSKNHSIQHFTQFGVFIGQFGRFGEMNGEFNEPCDVMELPNGDVAVADSKNRRLQVFTNKFTYKYHIDLPGPGLPYSLGTSRDMHVAVAMTDKRLYIVDAYEQELKRSFPVGARSKSRSCPVHFSMTYGSEIVVSDTEDGHVYKYSLDGQQLARFRPAAHAPGLSISIGGVCVTPLGQVLLVDTLNHLVNLYSEKGDFIQQVLTPTDGAGSIHALALGTEGHMAVTEFSVGGGHCAKIFRFRLCPCHGEAIPATKRSSATTPDMLHILPH